MSDYPEPDVAVESRSPEWLADRLTAGDPVRLLDVRNRDEFEDWQITGPSVEATLIPYMQWLQAEVQDSVADRADEIDGEGPITVVCGKGEASAYVAGLLTEAGIEAHNLAEGMQGWARVARTVELPCDAATVVQFQRPASGCLSSLLVAGDEAAVIDPLRAFTDRYVVAAAQRDAEITTVVDTHVHADHVSGLRELAEKTGATPVLPRLSVQRGVEFDVETIIDGEERAVGDATLRAVHLPGHTTGMTAFTVGNVLLSGDSIFLESVARPDLQRGEGGAEALAAQLYESLTERLADFDGDTLVAPGHYSEGTDPDADGAFAARLGDLRESLPVFEMDRTAFTARIMRDIPPQPDNFERIVAANLGLAELDDGAAFEVELGPNNCAATPSLGE
ncbi:MBL fold metallo-hydrolase [Halorientalis regularis]|jgi:glyoxylase-like metal-dependent hydrolase (beta-lactamase superfamily II)/rhodanese-related sulfurtransferase|uniref:Glyoxylase, beta-lactamase superfamily II n=1 Tax=Halorientalis regularis TaxID=660518 RepID=A0A1G7PXC6_9EURY|nr:MBL fold metallo-hydrolase [Halorientalis regularis]SDF90977.1 Glyoxylase, beta-lactamase superfamily II [Halorientalis regularis]